MRNDQKSFGQEGIGAGSQHQREGVAGEAQAELSMDGSGLAGLGTAWPGSLGKARLSKGLRIPN